MKPILTLSKQLGACWPYAPDGTGISGKVLDSSSDHALFLSNKYMNSKWGVSSYSPH